MNLGFIPARSGSKGIPDKNIQKINGTPLLVRAVETALEAKTLDEVIVSTDSNQYARMAEKAGAQVPSLRAPELAQDESSIIDVLQDFFLNHRVYSKFALLEPTSPFRVAEDIDECLEKLEEKRFQSIVTTKPLHKKPENIFKKKDNGQLERYIKQPKEQFVRRQDMEHLCRVNGAVYTLHTKTFLKESSLLVDPVGFVEMEEERSLTIDTPTELELAKVITDSHDFF